MSEKQLYIFDLDGTLVDAYKAIEKSLNFTLKKLGYNAVPFQKVKKTVGKGDKLFMQSFFDEKDIGNALKIFRKHHRKSLMAFTKLKPYAKFLLRNLKKKDKILAIASNRPSAFTNIILKALGIRKYFDYVLCADQIESLKPKPKILNIIVKKFKARKENTVYVGDMRIDLETARRAKIDAIFVTGGSSSINEVKGYKKRIVHSLKEILS
jgi:HAD superfamily hydrolase (TIGR01549 family)